MRGTPLADRVAAMSVEQRARCDRLVVQNRDLAWWCARRNLWRVPWMEADDVFQLAMTGMWRAAMSWNPERASFSTYATQWMVNYIRREHVKCSTKSRSTVPSLSLDHIYGDSATQLDLLAAPDELDAAIFRLAVQRGLHGRTRRIIEARLDGATLQQIGESEGITKERVRQLILECIERDGLAA